MRGRTYSAKERREEQIQNIARIFARADRTLSGKKITTAVVDDETAPYPAWSDGSTITFNAANIEDPAKVENIIVLNGLNYHELSHILYTPRRNHSVSVRLRNEGLYRLFNMLEDQRIESLFIGRYPGTKPYFSMTLMRFVLNQDAEEAWTTFPLVWGRRYVGKKVRDALKAQWDENASNGDRIAEIIDEFRDLDFPTQMNTAYVLVHELSQLMPDWANAPDPFGHGANDAPPTEGAPQKGDKKAKAEEDKRQQEADEQEDQEEEGAGEDEEDDDEQEDGAAADDDEGDDEEGEDGDGDSDGDGDDEGEGDSEGDSEGAGDDPEDDPEEDDEEDDEDSDADGGDGDSDGEGDGEGEEGGSDAGEGDDDSDVAEEPADNTVGGGAGAPSGQDLHDLVQNLMDEAIADRQVMDDVRSTQRAITEGDGEYAAPLTPVRSATGAVDPSMRVIAKKIGNELNRISHDLDPGYHKFKSSGRVNMGRVMRGDDLDTVFDAWDEGKYDASDIEMVIACDTSSSMMRQMEEVSKALWCIGYGFQRLGRTATLSVVTFGDDSHMAYQDNERVSPIEFMNLSSYGGTNALPATQYGFRKLAASKRKHKIFLALSDGGWWDSDEAEQYVSRMNDMGVTTAAVYLDPNGAEQARLEYLREHYPSMFERTMLNMRHQSKIFEVIEDSMELVGFAKNLTKEVMRA